MVGRTGRAAQIVLPWPGKTEPEFTETQQSGETEFFFSRVLGELTAKLVSPA